MWAAEDTPDPIKIRSICDVSRIKRAAAAYPPLATQAGNVLAAAGRIVAAVAKGDPVLAPPEVVAERRRICAACELWDQAQGRCRHCGCTGLKFDLATERCPLDPPKWDRVTG